MSTSYDYSDILDAHTPEEATRATFWRARHTYPARADWGLLVLPRDLRSNSGSTEVPFGSLPWELRRHLGADDGRLAPPTASLPLYASLPDSGDWHRSDAYLLTHIPRDVLLELAHHLEAPSAVYAHRGRDAEIELASHDGTSLATLGRDRHGMVDPHELLETYLRTLLDLPDRPLRCYLAGTVDSWAVAMGCPDRSDARAAMHDRLRRPDDLA